jgi:hypothetical protein
MATQLVEEAAATSPPWAKAGVANIATAIRMINKNASFRITFLLIKYRQWVVDVILVQTPSRLRILYKA